LKAKHSIKDKPEGDIYIYVYVYKQLIFRRWYISSVLLFCYILKIIFENCPLKYAVTEYTELHAVRLK
jgi:hypothetical protein